MKRAHENTRKKCVICRERPRFFIFDLCFKCRDAMKDKALDFQKNADPRILDGEESLRMEWAINRALKYQAARFKKNLYERDGR